MNDSSTIAQGSCSGSFGEILQGVLPGGKKFLINLKVKTSSTVHLEVSSCQFSHEKEQLFAESYRNYSKSYKVLRNIMVDIGRHDDIFLNVQSQIPVGKGLSSSTADMVASIRALEKALSITLKQDYISRMLTEIEPNDGIHFPGSAAYHHATGELIWQSDYIPPLHLIGMDIGGAIDTVAFNAKPIEWSEKELDEYKNLLEEAKIAYDNEDLPTICAIATQSARKWQKCIPRKELDTVIEFVNRTGGLGVVNTHSGTFLGLMYAHEQGNMDQLLAELQSEFPDKTISQFQTLSC